MKIMQVISQLGNGGAEKLVVELCNEMSKEHEVILVSFKDIEDWMIFPKMLSSKVKLTTLHKKKGFSLKLILSLMRLLKKEKPDATNIHLDSPFKYVNLIIRFLPKLNFFYTIHSNFDTHKDKFQKVIQKARYYKTFICISESIFDVFKNSFSNLNFALIENGIKRMEKTVEYQTVFNEISTFKTNQGTKVLLAVGRIAKAKNYEMLVEVAERLDRGKVKILVIGDSHNKDLIRYFINCSPSNLSFIGTKSNVIDYFLCADAFIMSSLYEGMPITAIEAMSVGLPIICTPAGGLVDMVKPGINGFIAKDFSEEALKEQIENFLNADKELLEKIKENNIREFNGKYSIEKCANNYLELYSQAIDKRNNR